MTDLELTEIAAKFCGFEITYLTMHAVFIKIPNGVVRCILCGSEKK